MALNPYDHSVQMITPTEIGEMDDRSDLWIKIKDALGDNRGDGVDEAGVTCPREDCSHHRRFQRWRMSPEFDV